MNTQMLNLDVLRRGDKETLMYYNKDECEELNVCMVIKLRNIPRGHIFHTPLPRAVMQGDQLHKLMSLCTLGKNKKSMNLNLNLNY